MANHRSFAPSLKLPDYSGLSGYSAYRITAPLPVPLRPCLMINTASFSPVISYCVQEEIRFIGQFHGHKQTTIILYKPLGSIQDTFYLHRGLNYMSMYFWIVKFRFYGFYGFYEGWLSCSASSAPRYVATHSELKHR